MKAVILAGGKATRLRPLTHVTNKHLLPLYNEPVIFHSIRNLVEAGIDKIMLVSSPEHIQHFVSLLNSGQPFKSKTTGKQVQIVYGIQNEPRGIAEGLWIAKDYIGNEDVILYLGDNIVEDDISGAIANFKGGATVFLTEVSDPERYGIAEVDAHDTVVSIEEKPAHPKSNLAVVGAYIYDNTVFDRMKGQPMSERGEYEITYVNNEYLKDKKLKAIRLQKPWFDVGTFDSLHDAGAYMREKHAKKPASEK